MITLCVRYDRSMVCTVDNLRYKILTFLWCVSYYVAENSHKIPYTHEVRTCCYTYI